MAAHENGSYTDEDMQDRVNSLVEDAMNALAGLPPEEG